MTEKKLIITDADKVVSALESLVDKVDSNNNLLIELGRHHKKQVKPNRIGLYVTILAFGVAAVVALLEFGIIKKEDVYIFENRIEQYTGVTHESVNDN